MRWTPPPTGSSGAPSSASAPTPRVNAPTCSPVVRSAPATCACSSPPFPRPEEMQTTPLNSSPTDVSALSLHDALPISIVSAVTTTWYPGFFPSVYEVDTSPDGVNWSSRLSFSANTAAQRTDVFPGGEVSASYLRLLITAFPTAG